MSQLFITVIKYLRQSTLKEESFAWAHSFGGFSKWSVDSVAFGSAMRQNNMMGSEQGGKVAHCMTAEKEK